MTRARAVAGYFDAVAHEYASRYADPGPAGHALRIRWERLIELIGAPPGRVLDAGSGPGLLVAALRDQGWTAISLDLSPGMAAIAGSTSPAMAGSADSLPFADASFDRVIATGVIEYIGDDRRALAELVRVLKPGGALIATFPHRSSLYRRWRNGVYYPLVDHVRTVVAPRRARQPSVTAFHHAYDVRQVRDVLGNLGCPVDAIVSINHQLFPAPFDTLVPIVPVAVSRFLERRAAILPDWLATAFIVRAKLTA